VLVVFTEFEPVNPSFGEDGTPTFGEDGTPGLRSLASGLHLFCRMAQWTEGRVYFVIKQEVHMDGVKD